MSQATVYIFGVLSLLFAGLSAQNYFRKGRKLSIAARVWLRIAIVFAAVTVLLAVVSP